MNTTVRSYAALAATLLAVGCSGSAKTASVEKPWGVPVRTAAVESRDLDETLVLTGTLRPRAQVQVVAELQARLLKVLKDEGARAEAGEALAVLDDTDYRLAHDRVAAALALAEANRSHALAESERAENLLKTGGITDKDRLSAQVALKVAEAQQAQVRAELAIAAQQLARTQVKAPFAGRVAKRLADPGAMLAAGTPLFTFVDDATLEFRASVPSADFGKLRLGATVDVTVDAVGGRTVKGTMARISPLVEERTRSFEATVQVPGVASWWEASSPARRCGSVEWKARSSCRRRRSSATAAPPPMPRPSWWRGEGRAQDDEPGRGTADAIQITSGLKAGDVVVLDPPAALGSGAPVESRRET